MRLALPRDLESSPRQTTHDTRGFAQLPGSMPEEFLRNPDKYTRLGACHPRGVLLVTLKKSKHEIESGI